MRIIIVIDQLDAITCSLFALHASDFQLDKIPEGWHIQLPEKGVIYQKGFNSRFYDNGLYYENTDGLKVVHYKHSKLPEHVLTAVGTNFMSSRGLGNAIDDVRIMGGYSPASYQDFEKLIQEIRRLFPNDKITLVGHSLGADNVVLYGALNEDESMHVYGYECPGVKPQIQKIRPEIANRYFPNIEIFNMKDSIISHFHPQINCKIVDLEHPAVDKKELHTNIVKLQKMAEIHFCASIGLDFGKVDPDPSGVMWCYGAGINISELHSIKQLSEVIQQILPKCKQSQTICSNEMLKISLQEQNDISMYDSRQGTSLSTQTSQSSTISTSSYSSTLSYFQALLPSLPEFYLVIGPRADITQPPNEWSGVKMRYQSGSFKLGSPGQGDVAFGIHPEIDRNGLKGLYFTFSMGFSPEAILTKISNIPVAKALLPIVVACIGVYSLYRYLSKNPLIENIRSQEKQFRDTLKLAIDDDAVAQRRNQLRQLLQSYQEALKNTLESSGQLEDSEKAEIRQELELLIYIPDLLDHNPNIVLNKKQVIKEMVSHKLKLIFQRLMALSESFSGLYPKIIAEAIANKESEKIEEILDHAGMELSSIWPLIASIRNLPQGLNACNDGDLEKLTNLRSVLIACHNGYQKAFCYDVQRRSEECGWGAVSVIIEPFIKERGQFYRLAGNQHMQWQLLNIKHALDAAGLYALSVSINPSYELSFIEKELNHFAKAFEDFLSLGGEANRLVLAFAMEYLTRNHIKDYPFPCPRKSHNSIILYGGACSPKKFIDNAEESFYKPQHKIVEVLNKFRSKPINRHGLIDALVVVVSLYLVCKHPAQAGYEENLIKEILNKHYDNKTRDEAKLAAIFLLLSQHAIIKHKLIKEVTQNWNILSLNNRYLVGMLLTFHPNKLLEEGVLVRLIQLIESNSPNNPTDLSETAKQNTGNIRLLKIILITINYQIEKDHRALVCGNNPTELLPEIIKILKFASMISCSADLAALCKNNWQIICQSDPKDSFLKHESSSSTQTQAAPESKAPSGTNAANSANSFFKPAVNQLLLHVARGEQDQAEALLRQDRTLALHKGQVIDYSERMFKNISAFQYALWALDWHMWKMILKYLPHEQAVKQLQEHEAQGTEYGTYYDFKPLIRALQDYVHKCATWDDVQREHHWVKMVGGAQQFVPAHVANEYCRLDRAFLEKPPQYFTPSFTEASLPRTLKIYADVDWFPLKDAGSGVGLNIACHRCAAPYLLWNVPGSRYAGRALTGYMNTLAKEVSALSTLCQVRTSQLDKLKQQLLSAAPTLQPSRI